MVAIDPQKPTHSNNFLNDYSTQIVIGCASLFIFTVIVAVLIKYRSKWNDYKNNKKNSCGIIDNTGFAINTGNLSTNVRRMKIPHFTSANSDSESSEDVLYQSIHRQSVGSAKSYTINKVQPTANTNRPYITRQASRQTSNSSVEENNENISSNPCLVVSVANEGDDNISISLVKAKNLRRSGDYSTDKLQPEGLFARLFPTIKTFSSKNQPIRASPELNYFQTSLVKSKKSKHIKFSDSDKFTIRGDQFPLRISLYECDKQKTRLSVGHCYLDVNARDCYLTNQVIKLDLSPTIYSAQYSKHRESIK